VIYKMHGDIEHAHEAILSRDDYERYHQTHGPFITALSGDLVEKTFLFLGFSFTDPNLEFILSRIRTTFIHHQRQHFCIMRRRTQGSDETNLKSNLLHLRLNAQAGDLKRLTDVRQRRWAPTCFTAADGRGRARRRALGPVC